jgi:hypothetical protein
MIWSWDRDNSREKILAECKMANPIINTESAWRHGRLGGLRMENKMQEKEDIYRITTIIDKRCFKLVN